MAVAREKSIVRFESDVVFDKNEIIDTSLVPLKASTPQHSILVRGPKQRDVEPKLYHKQPSSISLSSSKFAGRNNNFSEKSNSKMSSILSQEDNILQTRNKHQYIPRLHRQTTKIQTTTALGTTLHQFAQKCLVNEHSFAELSKARIEFQSLINKTSASLSRNIHGLNFLPAVFVLGFSHWQTVPEKRITCYLPIRLPKIVIHPTSSINQSVLLELPPRFPSNIHIDPSIIESDNPGRKLISTKKFYSLVLKTVRRILLLKSTPLEMMRFSSTERIMEICLHENGGWVGEIVPCVVVDGSANCLYCSKPIPDIETKLNRQNTDIFKHSQYINDILYHPEDFFKEDDDTPRSDSASLHRRSKHNASINMNNSQDGRSSNRSQKSNKDTLMQGCTKTTASLNETGLSNTILSDNGKNREIIPKMYVNKPQDQTEEQVDVVDIVWYPCNPKSENAILDSISRTDGGVRMTAMFSVCKLFQSDWRLLSTITCYDVQTALIHHIESRLDHKPRWQRDSLELCVRSLLTTLYKFANKNDKEQNLGLVNNTGIDLWSRWNEKQRTLAVGALQRLVSSDTALASLVNRASRIK